MSWFKNLLPGVSTKKKKGVPEGIWDKCSACAAILYRVELERNFFVCPKCNHHIRITARQRLDQFLDKNTGVEIGENIVPVDLLRFRDTKKYKDRLSIAQKHSHEKEAIVVMSGTVYRLPVVVAVFNFFFIGGSMGAAVGERFVLGVESAIERHCPFICFATSGGARMQEGLFSLFQMARTSTILAKLGRARLPFISILVDPTMGGVSASLATLGDIIIAEPKALIGFSGPRVIEQTIRQVLPEGFQRSEFLLEHGAIDMVVDRQQLKNEVAFLIANLTRQPQPDITSEQNL